MKKRATRKRRGGTPRDPQNQTVHLTAVNLKVAPPILGTPKLAVYKRPTLTVRLAPKLHEEVRKAAEQNGRSMSEEVERRVERASEWEAVFESVVAFKAKFEADRIELERGDAETVLPRRGYTKMMLDARLGGHAWIPPTNPRVRGTQ